jgi:hypothetical protein
MIRPITLALSALLGAVPVTAATLTTSKSFSAIEVEKVSINFPAGELVISAADEMDAIHVTMIARCRSGSKCEERVQRLRLVSDIEGDTRVFRLEGQKNNFPGAPTIKLRFEIPPHLAVSVHMGAGEVDIRDLAGNLGLTMGAGDVEIRALESSLRTVDVHVGVGDANLRVGERRFDGRGFLAKRLQWSQGSGLGRLEVDLGAGDVNVALN